jgi:hypothetical protein
LVPLRKEVASKISFEARFNRSGVDCSVISNAYGKACWAFPLPGWRVACGGAW